VGDGRRRWQGDMRWGNDDGRWKREMVGFDGRGRW